MNAGMEHWLASFCRQPTMQRLEKCRGHDSNVAGHHKKRHFGGSEEKGENSTGPEKERGLNKDTKQDPMM